MQRYTKLTFKIYWQHVRKYKLVGIVMVVCATFAFSLNLIPPLLYKQFFDILVRAGETANKIPQLFHLLFLVGVAYFFAWCFWRIGELTANYFWSKIMADLADTCFAYLHKHSFVFFQNNFVGSLVKRVNRFYRSFEGIADIIVWELLNILVTVIWILSVLFLRSPLLALVIFIWLFIFVLINYYFSMYKLKYDIARSEQDTKVTGVLADTVTNNTNVKLFVGYDRERGLFATVTKEWQRLRKLTWDLSSIFNGVQSVFAISLEITLFYFAIKLWQKGILTIGDFILIQAYLIAIFHKFWDFGRIIRRFYEHLADAEEMTAILDTPHEITNKPNAKKLRVKQGRIEFVKVRFNYHETRNVLPEFSLMIRPEEKIALIGPSGAGKSTVVKLLLRMYDLTGGQILIDGQNIADVTQESLWQNISLVPQEPILFHRTLMENIRYGKPEATDKEVKQAAKLARCHEFISSFPEGYKTYVGERGIKLSGGERQRVAIARAILRNAPILILDEATSSLDSVSEKLIQEALDSLMADKTVIVVAHRLSTIMRMDRIIVVDEGLVKEQGKHQELTQKKFGLYRRLWDVQAGGFLN